MIQILAFVSRAFRDRQLNEKSADLLNADDVLSAY